MVSPFVTSYTMRAPSTLGTMWPLICLGHWMGCEGDMSKYSRSSSSRVTPKEVLSTTRRTLEALEMGGRERPRTRWTNEDLPTPVAPITLHVRTPSQRGGGQEEGTAKRRRCMNAR